MDVSIRAFIYSLCSFVFSDDICSLNFMPNKTKLLSAIVIILLILVVLYKKIIKTHNNFEEFANNKYKCCRKIPMISNQFSNQSSNQFSKPLPNTKLAELQTINTPCSNYTIKKSNIDYLFRKKDKSHAYLGNRCLNTYAISKKLMKRYKNVKNMFNSDFPLFDKV